MKRARTAFTLIELLVVVAIIALLISILLPSLAQARNQTKAAVCGSNMRQQGLGLAMYVHEEKGYFPSGHLQPPINNSLICWVPRIRRYMGGTSANLVFWCPAAPAEFRWVYKLTDNYSTLGMPTKEYGYAPGEKILTGGEFFSYGYNEVGSDPLFQDPKFNPGLGMHTLDSDQIAFFSKEVHERQVRVPADMVAITDSIGDGSWDTWVSPRMQDNFPGTRHYGGCQVVFVDGHAQYYKLEKTIAGQYRGRNINKNAEGERINIRWNSDRKARKSW